MKFSTPCTALALITAAFVLGVSARAQQTSSAPGTIAQLRVQVRLVEVYATVFDGDGHYVDGLTRDNFSVLEDGKPQQIATFETNVQGLSCAVLLDTTGSMAAALPTVKNSIIKLIDALGPEDSIAIYTFDRRLVVRQDFTRDKTAAKRAVLRLRAEGETALFDAIAETAQEVAARSGKKALVVFTDGDDNASTLNANAAMTRAKKLGVPLYSIAEGEATKSVQLRKVLESLSESTGGKSHEVKKNGDIERVFADISRDLQHLYLLTYKPPPGDAKWRKIELLLSGERRLHVRAKQGYFGD